MTKLEGENMRIYNYKNKWEQFLTPEIVSMLTQIHEFKGKQNMFIESSTDALTALVEIAKIQSTEASNKIEGIYTSDDRIKKLALSKANPKNRAEEEIAGYRDILNTIHSNHDGIPLKPNIILQLHRDLYRFNTVTYGGQYKNVDNVIAEEDCEGNKFVRFQPVEAWEVPGNMESLCAAYNEAIEYGQVLDHMANRYINIDLDDGVKVNYEKFQNVELVSDNGTKVKKNLLVPIK